MMARRLNRIAATAAALGAACLGAALLPQTAAASACDLHYVAMGDDIPAGNDISAQQAYPKLLLDSHLVPSPGTWCMYGSPSNGTTSSQIISQGQLSTAWNMLPDLVTLSVGEQNSPIENVIDSCFSDIQSHDFPSAAGCAGEILGDTPAFDSLGSDLTTILQDFAMMMSGRPDLVVVVVGYPNPYPSFDSAEENVPQLCSPLVDTELTCLTRWEQFPPVLELIDQVFNKLNSTLSKAVLPFAEGYRGRFMFVDPTSAFSSHCMTMDVSIQTQVSHGEDIEEEDSQQSFGCDNTWWSTHGAGNFDPPTYLEPAESGVLVGEEQETTGMGIFPNQDGQQCIADLIWEAAKIKLSVPQAPSQNVCGQSNSTSSNPLLNPTGTGTGEASAGGAAGAAGRTTTVAKSGRPRRRRSHPAGCTPQRRRHRASHTGWKRCGSRSRHRRSGRA